MTSPRYTSLAAIAAETGRPVRYWRRIAPTAPWAVRPPGARTWLVDRALFDSWLHKTEQPPCPAPPPYVWTPRKPAPRQRVLSPAEAIALIDACVMPHVRLFVVLALTTGARSGALLGLTWDRVDFDGGSIDLRERVTVDPLTKRARKGRAIAPMTSVARVALLEAREGALSDHVIEWDGQPVGLIRRGFMEAVGRAGLGTVTPMRMPNGKPYNKVVSDVTPHTLRHTATSWAVNSGASMEFAARLLGHRDPKTTRSTYAHADVDSLRPVADVIDMKIRRKV